MCVYVCGGGVVLQTMDPFFSSSFFYNSTKQHKYLRQTPVPSDKWKNNQWHEKLMMQK